MQKRRLAYILKIGDWKQGRSILNDAWDADRQWSVVKDPETDWVFRNPVDLPPREGISLSIDLSTSDP
jgi:hypothetical protein